MSTLHVENLKGLSSGGNANKIIVPSGQTLYAPGHVVQTLSTTKSDVFANASSSLVDITGMSLTVTPKFASSKILIRASLNWGGIQNLYAAIRLYRDSTFISNNTSASGAQTYASIGLGTQNDSSSVYKMQNTNIEFLDAPSTTSATTYKLQQQSTGGPGTNTFYLNRPSNTDNAAYIVMGTSTITLQEIAA